MTYGLHLFFFRIRVCTTHGWHLIGTKLDRPLSATGVSTTKEEARQIHEKWSEMAYIYKIENKISSFTKDKLNDVLDKCVFCHGVQVNHMIGLRIA